MGASLVIPNYEIIDTIFEGSHATIYRAFHKRVPERILVLKVLKETFLSERKRSQFRQKIEHLKVLNYPMVITPIAFEARDGVCFTAQDYFAGVTLDRLKENRTLPLSDFFTVACNLARTLDKIHEAGIIHGGIKPHNILVDPVTLEIRLIDFISSIDIRDVSHFIYDLSFVRGTLAYTSPEQTGRISHRVVFSSDLYSLGIVFYELLTNRLPFVSDDPLELIHSHLAQEAPQIHQLSPEVPVALSGIVAKLILKAGEALPERQRALRRPCSLP